MMSTTRPAACVFDLNGTLLDLSVLEPHFAAAFGDPGVRTVWFRQTLELALTQTALASYISFDRLADAALDMTAARLGVALSAADKAPILAGMSALPAYADVPEALSLLRSAGIRLAALTNSVLPIAQAQVSHAKLAPYFEHVLSADTVQQLKPGPRTYIHAAETLGLPPAKICLIVAHSWDIAGAFPPVCKPRSSSVPTKPSVPSARSRRLSGRIYWTWRGGFWGCKQRKKVPV